MLALALAALLSKPATIERDDFGVPRVVATTKSELFRGFGQAVAEDRLWQLETNRRMARGEMAEIEGDSAVAADIETRKTGYSAEELDAMFKALPAETREAFEAYAAGVNEVMAQREKYGALPFEYEERNLRPRPWTTTDSCAIAVMLARRFGTGGAGELRNMALWKYLQSQPVKDRVFDVMDDLLWIDDPRALCTLTQDDDPLKSAEPPFPRFTKADTERQLKSLPDANLLELAGSIRAANGEASREVAARIGAPSYTGSYCIVVAPSRSKTGNALLLSAPQMGFSTPAIVHEVVLDGAGVRVAGINVPGIPAVVIGTTPNFAWGMTTGVADTADIVAAPLSGEDAYTYGDETRPIERRTETVRVLGKESRTVVVERTHDGPVLLKSRSGKAVFSQRASWWKKELDSFSKLMDLYGSMTAADIDRHLDGIAVNFNLFYATTGGETGWRFTGAHPVRPDGVDPRFPILSGPETDWKGFRSHARSPHVLNPKSGLMVNWNNKPVAWWPNGDTPAWGEGFRNELLARALGSGPFSPYDLERAAWEIARRESDSNGLFEALFLQAAPADSREGRLMRSFDGWAVDGSAGAMLYQEAVKKLRRLVFRQHVGNFTSEAFFDRAVQPTVMLRALRGETRFDYLQGRSAETVARQALEEAAAELAQKLGPDPAFWGLSYQAPSFSAGGEARVPYSNRGTYIQVVELGKTPAGRSVLPPGVQEAGEHEADQTPLARAWTFKPMHRF
ncbi:MAG: penicillin acylase family protein [Fimbriimonadaceae bacterium]|nr:penicillin acylase family protein [Fimbriimonadaceae bacterium]QYK59550.1 MAG: penicillin acylase family protein [Fimbriimonadaceae bacterium]